MNNLGATTKLSVLIASTPVERVITKFTAVHGWHRPYPSSTRFFNVSACVLDAITFSRVMTLTVIRNKELRRLTKSMNSGEVIPMPFKVVEFDEW